VNIVALLYPASKHFKTLAGYHLVKLSYAGFLNGYKGRRRQVYERAVTSLGSRPVRVQDSYLSSFIKSEKLDLTSKPDPVPRVIQPRSPRYNVEVGRYIRPLEAVIFKVIARMWGGKTVFKGMNALEQGKRFKLIWDRFRDPVALSIDAKRFDQHVAREMLKYEHGIYDLAYRDAFLRLLLSWQEENHGFARTADGLVKYFISGCRASGDMNTSLGACLIMCNVVYSYIVSLGLRPGVDVALANNGDDCVLVTERAYLARVSDPLPAWFLQAGFTMVCEDPVDELEKVEFCKSHPVWTSDGYVMVRKFPSTLSKDIYTTNYSTMSTSGGYDVLRRAISDSGNALAGNIPCYNEFYRMLGRGAENATNKKKKKFVADAITGFDMLARGMLGAGKDVHPKTRVSFWRAFGYLPHEQLALEEEFAGITPTYHSPQRVQQFVDRLHILC